MAQKANSPVRLQIDSDGRIARLTLQAPPLNILDRKINAEIVQAICRAEKAGAGYLLIASGIPGVFSAGVSIPEHQPKTVRAMLLGFHEIFRKLHGSPLITLAAINGHCYGGGAELALFCDFVLASRNANIGFPEITLGCLPPVASLILQKKCGSALATDLVLAGRTLTGAEAAATGLATRLLPGGKKFGPALEKSIRQITGHSAAAQRHARAALRLSCRYHESFEERLGRIEDLYLMQLMKTRDASEGIAAFMEKRKPRWMDA